MTGIESVTVSRVSSTRTLPNAAYLHIPFCRRRCYYCDFPISVVGDRQTGATSGTITHYVEALCQEIRLTAAHGPALQTVFFGGGTPSLLSVPQLEKTLATLVQQFGIAADAEISIEMDPGTFDWEQLQGYRSAGINRVSLGVQAFQSELLAACGRSHQVADIYTAIELLKRVGMPVWSLDLISGLPHQTLSQWQESLRSAIALAPPHLSIYDLTIETGTVFGRQYQPGQHPLPTDETTAQMYRLAQQCLVEAGYEHYEISNYAQPGYQCQHNRVYWENRPFYGFGMGATSYLQERRLARPRKTREYYQWLQDWAEGADMQPAADTQQDILLDTLMLGFRLQEGICSQRIAAQFGGSTLTQLWNCLIPYYQKGWVEVVDRDLQPIVLSDLSPTPLTARFRLQDPEGFLFSNVILSDLFAQLEARKMKDE